MEHGQRKQRGQDKAGEESIEQSGILQQKRGDGPARTVRLPRRRFSACRYGADRADEESFS
jgi:hypothetical protein